MSDATTTKKTSNVTLTIDGRSVTVPEGTLLIEAAKSIGIYIFHYCYHPALSVAGSCRLCLVEIKGMAKLQIACSTPVKEGMEVFTNSDEVKDARIGMMEFLLANHPLDCPVCDRGGECMLQRFSVDYGIAHSRFIDEKRRFRKPQFDPLIDIERNRCIMCTRCVRFCDEIAGEHVLGVFSRGDKNYIGTYGDGPVSNIFSGNVIDLCPVGTLTSKPFRFHARVWELHQLQTTCPYCASGCAVTSWTRDGKVYRTTPPIRKDKGKYALDEDTTEFICNQGRFGLDIGHHHERLRHPTIRQNGKQTPVMWEEAIRTAAQTLRRIRDEHGPQAVAFLASPRATCEELYLVQRLARHVIGTNNIDWRAHLASPDMAAAFSVAMRTASGALEDLSDLDCVLVVDADLLHETPVTALKLREAARKGKIELLLLGHHIDSWLAPHAKAYLHCLPDQVHALIHDLDHAIAGAEPASADLQAIHELSGAEKEIIARMITSLQGAGSGAIIYGLSGLWSHLAPSMVDDMIALRNTLGPRWTLLPIIGERNASGAFAVGCQSDRLPGSDSNNQQTWDSLESLWGKVPLVRAAGLSAPDILEQATLGEIKALVVLGSDALLRHPKPDVVHQALRTLEHLVVIDVFPSPVSEQAHVVLPGALFNEKNGTYIDAEGQLARLCKGDDPPTGTREDWQILADLAKALQSEFPYQRVDEVFAELMNLLRPPCPFSLEELAPEGPGPECPIRCAAAPRDRFHVLAGKYHALMSTFRPTCHVRFAELPTVHAAEKIPPIIEPGPGLILTWAPILQGSDHWGDRSPTMAPLRPSPYIEIHPLDAREMAIQTGDAVELSMGELRLLLRAVVCIGPAPGSAHVAANLVDLPLGEYVTRLPRVQLRKVEGKPT
jgi:NADH-quinone oxidoreductase chain G